MNLLIFLISFPAGAIAALSGFGIGSLLTPVFAWQVGTKLAVALVVIPHFLATAYRFWLLRAHIDRKVLWTFGTASTAGGLAGAYLHTLAESRLLSVIFGSLLILTAAGQGTGFWNRIHFGPKAGVAAGVFSGVLGGLVGNQGGIRTAAMFGFQVPKEAFVATGTAAALAVDLVRMPVYVWSQKAAFTGYTDWVIAASIGTLLGTWAGIRWLRRIPEPLFRKLLAFLLLFLGVTMLSKAIL
jgi:uncharacterized membrane protein YfcA